MILGAGLAGLATARVLADHYAEVVLVERDLIGGAVAEGPPVPRPNVPQGAHAHGLLDSGRRALVRLFPGLAADVEAAGGITPGGLTAGRLAAGEAADPAVGDRYALIARGPVEIRIPSWWIGGFAASRVLIEHVVRRRVLALPQVTVVEGTTVTGLRVTDTETATGGGRRVAGVELSRDGVGRSLEADLVVDATGRTSKLPTWLEAGGFPVPERSRVLSDVRYASVLLDPGPAFDPPWLYVLGALASSAGDGQYAGAVLIPVEGGRLHLSVGTLGGGSPPTSWAGYRAYVEATCVAPVADAVRASTPVSPISTYRVRGTEFRHYDRIRRPAPGVVAVGDSVCAFNPVYGQGMSVAVLGATALGEQLAADGGRPGPGFERRVARAVAAAARPAWDLALGEDLRLGVGTENVRGVWTARRGEWYRRRLERAASLDPEVALAYGEVVHLNRTAAVFGTPRLVRRVLRPLRDRHPLPLAQLAPKLADVVPSL